MIRVDWNPSSANLRVFALLLAVFSGIVGYLVYRSGSSAGALTVWVIGGTTALAGLIDPPLIRLVYVIWMACSYPIGLVMSNLILAGIFYLVITPVALIQRSRGWDPLCREFHPSKSSYWGRRQRVVKTARYFREY